LNRIENDIAACFYKTDAVRAFVEEVCRTAKAHPEAIQPFNGESPGTSEIFSSAGLTLLSTVEHTTLVASGCGRYFFKILHALTLKARIKNLVTDKAKSLCRLSEKLRAGGIGVPEVEAWGTLYNGRRRFFVMSRVAGESLYDVSVRKGRRVPVEIYRRVMDEVLKLHAMGYLMGDAHPSHVFIFEGRVSGIIDIDGIRRNLPVMPGLQPLSLRGIARDLAGLNHPGLLLDEAQRAAILQYYIRRCDPRVRKAHEKLRKYFKTYSERRWKAQA